MKIAKDVIEYALTHILDDGDTDIFPYPFELKFYAAKKDVVAKALSDADYTSFQPLSLVESLVPKSKYGFRTAHQAYPSDTIVYTALVCSLIDEVEAARSDTKSERAFSYRKNPGLNFPFFIEKRNFKNWIGVIEGEVFSDEYSHVIRTDISDYYQRIYRHRLENILASLSGKTPVVKKIERILATWRGGQSFGIPVGSDASRLLAEVAMHDTDMALMSEDYWHSRYVDDIVIMVKKDQNAYAALAFVAKHLSENEGLSLNNQKTTIFEWNDFFSSLPSPSAEDEKTKDDWATEKLFWAAYAKDEMDQDALNALMTKDLAKELETQLSEPYWDMGAIRIILHAMRLVGGEEVASYIRTNLQALIPFAKDVCLLIENFIGKGVKGFEGISSEIVDIVVSATMRPLDCARAWFLELGVRGLVDFSMADLRRLEGLSGTLDVRQTHLLRWRAKDVNYFRSKKSKINEINVWAQPSFIFGASCLPGDEYGHWVRGLKSRIQFPLAREFADWCIEIHGTDPFK